MNEEINEEIEANTETIEDPTEGTEAIELPSTQPKKKERSQKQKDALIKAREARKKKAEDKKKIKLEQLPPKHIKYKPRKPLPMIVESEEPQKVIIRRVKKKKKQKPIIIEEEYSEDDDELTQDDVFSIINEWKKQKRYGKNRNKYYSQYPNSEGEEEDFDEEEYIDKQKSIGDYDFNPLGGQRNPHCGNEWIDEENKLYPEEEVSYEEIPYDYSNNFT